MNNITVLKPSKERTGDALPSSNHLKDPSAAPSHHFLPFTFYHHENTVIQNLLLKEAGICVDVLLRHAPGEFNPHPRPREGR